MSNQIDELLNMPEPGGTLPILPDGLGPAPEPSGEPRATTGGSQIDETVPVFGQPTTQSVRDNFATAKTEITALMQATQGGPFIPVSGGHFTGPVYLFNDPTDVMMPVTLGYFDAHGGGGSGGGGIPEAPSDGKFYTRSQGAWVPGVALSGGALAQMTGELLLFANPTSALGATPKQYVDAIGTTATGAVRRSGDTMTGLLVLSADPAAALGAVTKQYADAGLALKAPIASPTFTGVCTFSGGRNIISAPSGPSLTLYDTTASRPCFGIVNTGGLLGIGLANPGTGNPTGTPFATMDQNGNWLFSTRINVTGGRLISSSATTSPSIALNDTRYSSAFGFWTTNNVLGIGIVDAAGSPSSALSSMDASGNWNMNGGVSAQGGFATPLGVSALNVTATSGIFTPGGAVITQAAAGGWQWNTGAGGYTFVCQPATDPVFYFAGPGGTILSIFSGGTITVPVTVNCAGVQCGGSLNSVNVFATAQVRGDNFLATNFMNTANGIQYGIGLGALYALRWDGSGLYCYVNTYGYIAIGPVSSEVIKRDIQPVTDYDALTPINAIPFYSYQAPDGPLDDSGAWKEAALYECGWLAQDLETLIPNSVDRLQHQEDDSAPDALFPQWQPILSYAVRAIQQLTERIAALEGARR